MESPPSIIELSRRVGLNDFKLKIGFKAIYGTTVYGLLRDERLEKARLLLEMNSMNVGEVAYSVGYSNPSHFANAFKKKFGINPGELVRSCNQLTYS
jgi:AraC-like DNA-binding protein